MTMTTDSGSTPPPSEDINALLRKAEMQQMQLQLEIQFKKNMALFKVMAKEIYDQFNDYEPEELRLSYDESGYLNLINYKLKGKPVYSDDPSKFTQQQFEDFTKSPNISVIRFAKSVISNTNHIHVPLINEMMMYTEETVKNIPVHCDCPIGLMLMTGCGLGYQLPLMVEKFDIYNLIVFDPHKDSFYAALHTIDWAPILSHFTAKGRMIKLFIGVSAPDAMAEIKLLTDKIGLHNLVYTFVYRHFNSKKEEEFIERYKREFHLNAAGTGFFDDEQVSLAHTVANLNNKTKVFKHDSTDRKHPPAFVLGNGPSLDSHIELIKKNIDNAIIFTCGTTISSLAKTGIKPDFHVEMERNINICSWIKRGTTEEYRKGITLLCLNTAAPDAIDLFDEACIAKKPNDIGEVIIDNVMAPDQVLALQLCNPTVTNAGLSFALAMGFKEIYLLGVDLGMKVDGKHHSDLSLYYDLERKTKTQGHTQFDKKDGRYKIEANFGGEVETNTFLDSTRVHMEILLRHFHRTTENIACYNPNDGAKIDGTETINPEDISIPTYDKDKERLVDTLKKRHFANPNTQEITVESIKKTYLKKFFDIRGEIGLNKKIKTPNDLYLAMNNIYIKIRNMRKTESITTMLLRGSMNGYFTLLMKCCIFQKNKKEFKESFEIGRRIYMQFLKECYQFMETQPLKLDDTYDKVAVKLKDDYKPGDSSASEETAEKSGTDDKGN